jgi:hypothetical protein
MLDQFRLILISQFEAGLSMLNLCLTRCPDEQWDTLIAKYPFWQVAYHALCFVDLYLSPSESAWQPRTEPGGNGGLHPKGGLELQEEYPSRRFERDELTHYVTLCRDKAHAIINAETPASLAGESGFAWLPFSRAELHLYNLRHLQHHTGQLGACLHRLGISADWVRSGWR